MPVSTGGQGHPDEAVKVSPKGSDDNAQSPGAISGSGFNVGIDIKPGAKDLTFGGRLRLM